MPLERDQPTRRILVMGLPGAGKTTLARILARRLNAVHFDADQVRANINRDLGFSVEDRLEHARRMGWLCDRVVETGNYAIADFICPLPETRAAFGPAFVVWVDRIKEGRFADTNAMFAPPEHYDVRVTAEGSAEGWAELIVERLHPVFDPKAPTALFVGRWQPFHDGHRALVVEGIRRVGQACIAVRDTGGTDAKNPYAFEQVRPRIEAGLADYRGRFVIVPLPNITQVYYGRNVGYGIEQIDLDPAVQQVSATKVRALLNDVARPG
ncbi:MAG: adenylyl-sulfate kinase [Acetobacteraceae bacterium]|nr:adenylyl-sulfate kinase [Acetobacteraceae bacterium]